MKNIRIFTLFFILLLSLVWLYKTLTGTSSSGTRVVPTPTPTPRLNAERQFEMINAYRLSKGLKPFALSQELCSIANQRADYFIYDDEHRKCMGDRTCPNGGHIEIEKFRAMYSGKAMGENVGAYATNDEENVEGWKNSPSHNANLLAKGWNGVEVDKACLVTREIPGHNVIVLLVGDK